MSLRSLLDPMKTPSEDLVNKIKEYLDVQISKHPREKNKSEKAVRTFAAKTKRFAEKQAGPDLVFLRNMVWSIQLDFHSCGAHSAYMILKHFGKARSIAEVANASHTTLDGTRETPLIKLLRNRGLSVSEMKSKSITRVREAIDQGSPVIASVKDGGHWVVVYGYSPGRVWVLDPSLLTIMRPFQSIDSFRKKWDGFGLVISMR